MLIAANELIDVVEVVSWRSSLPELMFRQFLEVVLGEYVLGYEYKPNTRVRLEPKTV